MWEEGGRDDFGDEGEEGGEEVCDRQVQDEVVHPTHLRILIAVPLSGGQSEGDTSLSLSLSLSLFDLRFFGY